MFTKSILLLAFLAASCHAAAFNGNGNATNTNNLGGGWTMFGCDIRNNGDNYNDNGTYMWMYFNQASCTPIADLR